MAVKKKNNRKPTRVRRRSPQLRTSPAFVTPMAAQVVKKLPEGDDWAYDLKFRWRPGADHQGRAWPDKVDWFSKLSGPGEVLVLPGSNLDLLPRSRLRCLRILA